MWPDQPMSQPRPPSDLEQELRLLRRELAELRASQAMHQEAREGWRRSSNWQASSIRPWMPLLSSMTIIGLLFLMPPLKEIFQCSAHEALGRTLDQFIPLPLRSAHREHIRRFAETGETSRRMGANMEISGLRRERRDLPSRSVHFSYGTIGEAMVYA